MNFRYLSSKTPVHLFKQYDCDFSTYIEKMRKVVADGRIDVTKDNAKDIVDANSPFEWQPEQPNGDGVLLVHGLFDSPFMMRDLARFFVDRGYLVRSVLMPGHGTVPGDLLGVGCDDWIECVQYGIEQTAPLVDKLYLCGFSLGAALSIINHQHATNIAGIIGIATGLKPAHRYAFVTYIHNLFTWISQKTKWYILNPQLSYVKYFSHNFHAAKQSMIAMNLARKQTLTVPFFTTISTDDETVKFDTLIDYFMQQTDPNSRFILYSNGSYNFDDPRIEYRTSSYPELNILNFSHSCIPIAPDNPYLGRDGSFVDLAHYGSKEEMPQGNFKLGAITASNLAHYAIERLNYNPDFEYMTMRIEEFIASN